MKTVLQTADGSHVHYDEIPSFNEPPAVIGWGDRVFTLVAPVTSEDTAAIYREVFAYALRPCAAMAMPSAA